LLRRILVAIAGGGPTLCALVITDGHFAVLHNAVLAC